MSRHRPSRARARTGHAPRRTGHAERGESERQTDTSESRDTRRVGDAPGPGALARGVALGAPERRQTRNAQAATPTASKQNYILIYK